MKVYIAGHTGMVGSALCRVLLPKRDLKLVTARRDELDLTRQFDVENFLLREKPDQIYLAAAKVGGIYANNTYPVRFILENLQVATNIISAAHKCGIRKLLFFGSSCIYPKYADQPIAEESLLSGRLEPTNEPYAIAKIAGLKLCEAINREHYESSDRDYRVVMPTNLYGPGDNYHSEDSHVVAALLRRFHEAKINCLPNVTVWGTGQARREFLFVDDLARAAVEIMNIPKKKWESALGRNVSHLNLGVGEDITILELAHLISKIVGYSGKITLDLTKPDGTPRKLLDISRMQKLITKFSTTLEDGLNASYKNYLDQAGAVELDKR